MNTMSAPLLGYCYCMVINLHYKQESTPVAMMTQEIDRTSETDQELTEVAECLVTSSASFSIHTVFTDAI